MIIKGIDTLEFGLDIEDYLDSFETYLDTFKKLKEEGQERGLESEIILGDINFKVHRSGIPFYAYRLSCNDFSICFMEKEMYENPPIRVRFMSSYLWSYGYKDAFQFFMEWFKHFDCIVTGNRISRVDICADSDKIYFAENDIKGIITKARSKTKHYVSDKYTEGRKFSGFSIGRGAHYWHGYIISL